MENTQTHDIKIFTVMVDMLIASGMGQKDFGFKRQRTQTKLSELANAMNQNGYTNRLGEPLNRNTLKQVVHRVRQKPDTMDALKPDWDDFVETELTITKPTELCLVCNMREARKNKKTCSTECGTEYQKFRNVPHDPKFVSIFHQMRYEEQFVKKPN